MDRGGCRNGHDCKGGFLMIICLCFFGPVPGYAPGPVCVDRQANSFGCLPFFVLPMGRMTLAQVAQTWIGIGP